MSSPSIAASWSAVVEDVEVLRDPGRGDRLRDGLTALLQVPAQHDLRGRPGVCRRDLPDHRVLESASGCAVSVEGDPADRRPRLGQDPLLGVDLEELGLPEVRVHLDLVHRGHHRRRRHQPAQVGRHEVADPDRTDLAVGQQSLQRLVGGDGELELSRQGLVQDQQVDLVEAELARALVEGVQGLVVAVVGDPHLRLDEDLRAVEAGATQKPTQRLAHLALVAVGRSGVDVPVTGGQRRLDGRNRLVRVRLEDAEPEGRHLDAVVEMQHGDPCTVRGHGRTSTLSAVRSSIAA